MRTICDVCESAAAVLFCAADEAALCRSCDDKYLSWFSNQCWSSAPKVYSPELGLFTVLGFIFQIGGLQVHMCNKLASRHVRVGLADPSEVPRCDICENAPAFFYCEIDGTSLCLQCDMLVHVGGKRTHGRYLLLRQRVEFTGDKQDHVVDATMQSKDQVESRKDQHHVTKPIMKERMQNHKVSVAAVQLLGANSDDHRKIDAKMIDLNKRLYQTLGQASNSRSQGMDHMSGSNNGGL